MADLSHLGGLQPVETLTSNEYPVNKEKEFRLAPKGVYTLQAPDQFPAAAFSRTKAGALQIQIDPTIVGPTNEGTVIKFQKISAKSFERNGKKASQVGDYLVSTGWSGSLSDEQSIADAVESTAGRTYAAKLDWRGYNKRTQFAIQGMEKFPRNADGTYQPYIIDPAEVDVDASKSAGKLVGKKDPDTGKELRVYANLEIPFGGFVAAAV
jgi:hypothetical protein